MLHPIVCGIPRLLRQLLAVLALHRTEQPFQIVQRSSARLRTPEPSRNALVYPVDTLSPPGDLCHLIPMHCHSLTSPPVDCPNFTHYCSATVVLRPKSVPRQPTIKVRDEPRGQNRGITTILLMYAIVPEEWLVSRFTRISIRTPEYCCPRSTRSSVDMFELDPGQSWVGRNIWSPFSVCHRGSACTPPRPE